MTGFGNKSTIRDMEQRRKHFTQMSADEIAVLFTAVRSQKFAFTSIPHANLRRNEKAITEANVLAALSYGTVIEVHNNIANELRVLVRGKVAGNFVCVVVSLNPRKVITMFWNDANDHHKTLDKSAYKWDTNIVELKSNRPELFESC